MRKLLISFVLLCVFGFTNAQNLYIKTFGNSTDKAVIYLHGGPGYNCVNFEATTAQKLANNGFFVIVYDRRGEGRSIDKNAEYSFKETFDDLNSIISKYNIGKTILIGHSFGGIVATLFTELYPEKIESVILVGAPVSLQESFKHIIFKSKEIYQSKNDKVNLNYLSILETMDTTSLDYSSYCFRHAMQNGFYTPKNRTSEAKEIYALFKTDTLLRKYASKMTIDAPKGFWLNENYTTINLTPNIERLLLKNIKIYGMYGKEDGLYSEKQIKDLQNLIGKKHLVYYENCSHNVFIDQQNKFIEYMTNSINK